jgi:hypothetical protein
MKEEYVVKNQKRLKTGIRVGTAKSFSIVANAYQNLVSSQMKIIYTGAETGLMCKTHLNVQ